MANRALLSLAMCVSTASSERCRRQHPSVDCARLMALFSELCGMQDRPILAPVASKAHSPNRLLALYGPTLICLCSLCRIDLSLSRDTQVRRTDLYISFSLSSC